MTEKEYFKIFLASVDVKNKNVLEIGGAVPPEWISNTGVSSWTSIDITENRFKGLQPGDALPEWYKPVKMDAADMTFAESTFDIVYSTNCFEHVWDLTSVLDHTYRVLKPQGILFSIFSFFWSFFFSSLGI